MKEKRYNCKCENPVVLFNPGIVHLMTTKNCTAKFGELMLRYDRLKVTYKSFPWKILYSWKVQVTPDNIDTACLVDRDGVVYPLFIVVPCGKCKLCTAQKVYDWCTRCMCESETSKYPPLFITLTFRPSERPDTMEKCKQDFVLFMKRLREYTDRKIKDGCGLRFVAVSEWTPEHHYPHVHMILWNMPYVHLATGCANSFWELIKFIQEDCWQKGIVRVERARDCSGQYIMKYMQKQGYEDCWRLSSRRPGIGYDFAVKLLPTVLKNPDMVTFQVHDGKGKLVHRSIPQYFRRLFYPTYSQLLPAPIIRALKDFLELSAELRAAMAFLYPGNIRHQRIVADHQFIEEKYGFLPFDFDDAKVSYEFLFEMYAYGNFRDLLENGKRIPENNPYDGLPFLALWMEGYQTHEYIYKPPLTPRLELKMRWFRHYLIDSWHKYCECFDMLLKFQFNKETLLKELQRTEYHKECLLKQLANVDPIDVAALVRKCEIDEDWIYTHWTVPARC